MKILLGVILALFIVAVASFFDKPHQPTVIIAPVTRTDAQQKEFDQLAIGQTERQAKLQKLLNNDSIDGLDVKDGFGHITFGAAMLAADPETKRLVAEAAFDWCRYNHLRAGNDCKILIIRNHDRHMVGYFDRDGLRMNKPSAGPATQVFVLPR